MLGGLITRSAIVAAGIATVFSLVSITYGTVEAQRFVGSEIPDSELRKHASNDVVEYFAAARADRSAVEEMVHAFSYPGYWRYWFRAFLLLFAAVFIGCLILVGWLNRSKKSN